MPLNVEKVKRTPPGVEPPAGTRVTTGIAPDDLFAAWIAGPAEILAKSCRAGLQAVLFDLDGVLTDTAAFHYTAWKRLADELDLPFDPRINHAFRGVGRMECLDKLLGTHARTIAFQEKRVLAERKNAYYLELVMALRPTDLAPGARSLAMHLRAAGIRMALVSASKNARLVVDLLGITNWFDAIIDGSSVKKGKPDPQGFLLAARKLRVEPAQCLVIEDAEAGIKAGHAAEMVCIGIGASAVGADLSVNSIADLTLPLLEQTWAAAGEV